MMYMFLSAESGSSMVGHHMDNSAEVIKGLESSQRSEGHQTTPSDKETEAQVTWELFSSMDKKNYM